MTSPSTFPGRFNGKAAVVTGAAQGVGLAVARRLGSEGASVVVADVAEGPAREAVGTLTAEGIHAVAAIADLSTLDGARSALQVCCDTFGGLDILVNNVGGAIRIKPFWHFTEEEMHEEVQRSLWPALVCSQAAVEPMRRRGGGSIVNIGSNASSVGLYRIPYAASKGAVNSLTTSLAVELGGMNIRVNCVSLGRTITTDRKTQRGTLGQDERTGKWMRQFARLVQTEELIPEPATAEQQAAIVAFVASDEAAHMTGEIIETGRRGLRIGEVLGPLGQGLD